MLSLKTFTPSHSAQGTNPLLFWGKKKSEKLLDCKISTGSDLLALFLLLIPLSYLSLCPLPSPFNRREPQYSHLSVSCGHSASPVLPLLPFHPKRPPAAQTPLFSLPNPAWGARAPLRSAAWAARAPLLPSGARRNRLRFSHRPPKSSSSAQIHLHMAFWSDPASPLPPFRRAGGQIPQWCFGCGAWFHQ